MEEKTVENKAEAEQRLAESEQKRKKLKATSILNLASYPAALAAGALAAWQYVRQESFEVMRRWGYLDRKINGGNSFNKWAHDENAKIKVNGNSHAKQAELRKKIEVKKKELFKVMGYKGIRDNWEILAKNNKAEAVGIFVAASSIALGALLVAANSKDIVTSLFTSDGSNEKKEKNSFVASLTNPRDAVVPPDSRTR